MSGSSYAITYTVKNEARLLPDAIRYHAAQGCFHFYVYLDGTTDGTRESILDLPNVTVLTSVPLAAEESYPAWMRDIAPMWDVNMDARKRFNTIDAAQRARDAGIEWIISIDPDEIIYPCEPGTGKPIQISDLLSSINAHVDQLLLKNLEAVPTRAPAGRGPFSQCVYFVQRFDATDLVRRAIGTFVSKLSKSPKARAWSDHLVYRARLLGAYPRIMRDPRDGSAVPSSLFLGYTNHKAFMRSARAEYFNFNIHKWQKSVRKPISVSFGYLLHYDIFDWEYFSLKFRQRNSYMIIADFFVRHRLGEIARECDDSEVELFFAENIALDAVSVDQLVKKGVIRRIDDVAAFFEASPERQSSAADG